MNEQAPAVYTVASRERVGNKIFTEVIRAGEIVRQEEGVEFIKPEIPKPEESEETP